MFQHHGQQPIPPNATSTAPLSLPVLLKLSGCSFVSVLTSGSPEALRYFIPNKLRAAVAFSNPPNTHTHTQPHIHFLANLPPGDLHGIMGRGGTGLLAVKYCDVVAGVTVFEKADRNGSHLK